MVPTQDQIDREFAEQEARNIQKFLARRAQLAATGRVVTPDQRDAAVELAAAGITPPGGWMTPVVDVNRTPLRPVEASAPNTVKPEAYCKYCGRLFKAKTVGAAKMAKGRHEKRDHVHDSAVA